MKKAVFPGSFDPFTLGHLDILNRSLLLFDEIIVGVGKNINKKTMFSEKQRVSFIKECFKNESKIGEFQFFNSSYLPGAKIPDKKSKINCGTILIKNTTNFQVFVGTTIFFPFNIPITPSSAILYADFFKNLGTLSISS